VPDPRPNSKGGEGPNSYVPKPRFEYKAPSIIAEHKYLTIIFVLAIVAASVYLIRAPHKPLTIEPPPPPPIYIEPIPERPAADSHAGRS
jgi:hypothetical protein